MQLSVSEKIKIIANRNGMTMAELAAATNQSRQNLSNKISRDNFTESDMRAIAKALNCEISIEFILPDGTKL